MAFLKLPPNHSKVRREICAQNNGLFNLEEIQRTLIAQVGDLLTSLMLYQMKYFHTNS